MSHHPLSPALTLGSHSFCGSPNLNIHTEVAKDAAVESITIQPWHKSAPWLISAATILGLIILFQR
jgi:hypothetical protein